jgi:hypothetical protein
VKVYRDHGVSGAKGRDKRPQFDALCRDATQRKFDLITAWSVDRQGRSLQDLVAFLSDIHALKIDLPAPTELGPSTPSGKAMFQMMGVFAEFERAIIQERVRAGLARVKSEGKVLGRPRIDGALEADIRGNRGIRGGVVAAMSAPEKSCRGSGHAGVSLFDPNGTFTVEQPLRFLVGHGRQPTIRRSHYWDQSATSHR